MADLTVLHVGGKSEQARALAAAMNRRFEQRGFGDRKVHVAQGEMTLTKDLLDDVITCAWALGAGRATLGSMEAKRIVPIGVARMIRNPGKRSDAQKTLGRRRIATRNRKARERAKAGGHRRAICQHAKAAAQNYRAQPGAYHYLAGGKANVVYLRPTPREWRSDCSQFVGSVYKDCGLPSPGDVAHEWVNTWAIERRGRVTQNPRPGDCGMYGPRGNPHHVELYIGEPGCEFIGHGSPPIDSQTPGRPDFYITFDFLD